MLERFKLLVRLEEKEGKIKKSIKHIAVTSHGMELWAEKNKKNISESYKKSFNIIKGLIDYQVKRDIPILTFYLLPEELKKEDIFALFLDELIAFLEEIKSSNIVHKNKMKVSILGKWYDLPGRFIEPAKKIIEETKDYDSFFLNFCINYNGQEEIVDACKMVARQIQAEKLSIDEIKKEIIKDNIYSSYFLPPDILIKNGNKKQTSGLLLWDSSNTHLYFSNKLFPDFENEDIEKALVDFSRD